MTDKHRGPRIPFESELERKLRMCLDRALVCQWKANDADKDGRPGRLLVLANRFAINEFFDLMTRGGDDGYCAGAALFARRAGEIERPVRARFLTLLARMLHDMHGDGRGEIREAEVAHFGRFVSALLAKRGAQGKDGRMDGVVLAWVEDMNATDPENDMESQPTSVIRGVLFSPSFDHRHAFGFWERASRSDRFPSRVFSDPCPPDDGAIFSSYHIRAFGLFFSLAPEGAVAKFAAHLRDHARTKRVREWIAASHTWTVTSVPASQNDRLRVWDGIAGYVDGERRKEQVRDILHAA